MIKVVYNRTRKVLTLTCYDHGQFPWGGQQTQGDMAMSCRELNIPSSARHTYLPLHLLIVIMYLKLASLDHLITTHKTFIKKVLSSNHMRDDQPALISFLKPLQLTYKICIRSIVCLPTMISQCWKITMDRSQHNTFTSSTATTTSFSVFHKGYLVLIFLHKRVIACFYTNSPLFSFSFLVMAIQSAFFIVSTTPLSVHDTGLLYHDLKYILQIF